MAHLIFMVDGLPEGIELLERRMDRHCFGVGAARLREIKLYDLQYDSRDEKQVTEQFSGSACNFAEKKFKDRLSYVFKHKNSIIKHGKFRQTLYLIFKYFGWVFGFKPFPKSETTANRQIPFHLVNVYPVCKADDTFVFHKLYGKEIEWM